MKLVSNITCIFAMIAQIFLSSMVFAHDVTCHSSTISADSLKRNSKGMQDTLTCGCCHSDSAISDLSVASEDDMLPDPPLLPCTCTSEPASAYLAAEYSVEIRDRKISQIPMVSIYSGQLFMTLLNSNLIHGDIAMLRDDGGGKQWMKLIHLPENSGRFVSRYLGQFLL